MGAVPNGVEKRKYLLLDAGGKTICTIVGRVFMPPGLEVIFKGKKKSAQLYYKNELLCDWRGYPVREFDHVEVCDFGLVAEKEKV